MTGSSLLRFAQNQESRQEKKLFWSRADLDGLPFRGSFAPTLPEEEYQERVVRVADFRNAFFDVTDPEQNRQYCEVMEKCANGWFQLRHQIFFWNNTTKHYVEWLEYYLEDGKPVLFSVLQNSPMEISGNAT